MLFNVYLFCLIVGGGLVVLSLMSGFGETEADVDAEAAELGGDLDAEMGTEIGAGDVEVSGGALEFDELPFQFDLEGAEIDADPEVESANAEMEYEVSTQRRFNPLTSLKFWTFTVAFFGLTGTIFEGLGLWESDLGVMLLSLAVGTPLGVAIAYLIHTADAGAGEGLTERDYLGASAEVRVPVRANKTGKIRLQLDRQLIDMRAELMEGEDDLERGEGCFVIGLAGEKAQVVSAATVERGLTGGRPESETVLESEAEQKFDEKLEHERKQQSEHATS